MADRWAKDRFGWPSRLADPMLTDRARHVGLVLYGFADGDTGECWPSFATLAKLTQKSLDTIKRAIRELEQAGYIALRRGNGRGNQSVFTLRVPPQKGCTIAPLPVKRGAKLRKKGSKSAHAYKEEPHQRTRMRERSNTEPWHRGKLIHVASGHNQQRLWRAWLAEEGWGDPESLCLIENDGTLLVPLFFPPDENHPVEPGLVRDWLHRRAAMLPELQRERA